VLFNGRVIFKQYIPKKQKCSGIKIYKLCVVARYTQYESIYGKGQAKCNTYGDSHICDRSLTSRVEGAGHKLFMNNFFSSPDLFDDLHKGDINYCGTIKTK
jgi:hypothetical protein